MMHGRPVASNYDSLGKAEHTADLILSHIEDLSRNSPEQAFMLVGRIVEDMNAGSDDNPVLKPTFVLRFEELLEARLPLTLPFGLSMTRVYELVCRGLRERGAW